MSRRLAKGIDLSVYQGAVLGGSWRSMARDGVKVAVVGSWHGTRPNQYVAGCLSRAWKAELITATYIAINGARPGRYHVDAGWAACLGEWILLSFAAIDVEVRGVTEEILDGALARVEELGKRPVIYTGRWFWNWWALSLGHLPGLDRPGGVSRYARIPLWAAHYNGVSSLDVPLYGGWERVHGHQYAGTTNAYGTQVDLNVFDAEWLSEWPEPPPPPPPPPDGGETMPSKEYRELKGLLESVAREVRGVKGSLTEHLKGHPKPAPAPAPKPAPRYYTVKAGDNASAIAQRHGLTWARFKALNPKGPPSGNWDLIHPGERFRVA